MEKKVNAFQLRLMEDVSREVKSIASLKGMTKHEWIEKAIREKLERDKAV